MTIQKVADNPNDRARRLRARALMWLAQREHSRQELRLKLLRHDRDHARRACRAAPDAPDAPASPLCENTSARAGAVEIIDDALADDSPVGIAAGIDPSADSLADTRVTPETPADAIVDQLLDQLTEAGYLDEQRFVASRIRVRAPRFGNGRIEAELRRHGLTVQLSAIDANEGAEQHRAQRIWARRFGPDPSLDAGERLRQIRFLVARGFPARIAHDIVRGKSVEPQE